jgi:hypothetical protein
MRILVDWRFFARPSGESGKQNSGAKIPNDDDVVSLVLGRKIRKALSMDQDIGANSATAVFCFLYSTAL